MNLGTLIAGLGAGAGLAYLLDPDRGKRRRTLLYDKMVHLSKRCESGMDTTMRDVRHRAEGIAAEMRKVLSEREEVVPDHVLAERVRARLGRFVSHPRAIDVTSDSGRVILEGPILANEVDDLLAVVASIRGVRAVDDKLEPHVHAEHVSALQGGRPRPGVVIDLFQTSWAPATRLAMSTIGGVLMLNCLARRTPRAMLLGTGGFLLFLRAATNMQLRRLFGIGDQRRGVDIQKTIHIAAPVEKVYDHWRHVENFPRFMSHVREVRDLGDGRTHWTIEGPTGGDVHFEAAVIKHKTNELLAWQSEPGSQVAHAGTIRFQPDREGTRIDVKMTYNPPLGACGHALAWLFGRDLKSEIDDDLMRMKTFIETEHAPHDAAVRE